ncbi:MAG: hypothetical protein ABIH39_05800 [Candidatus Margulisiibacteriota bacterium]
MLKINFYYNQGCSSCDRIKTEILLPLVAQKQLSVNWLDVDAPENFYSLLEAQSQYGKTYSSPTIVGEGFMLAGDKDIRESLPKLVNTRKPVSWTGIRTENASLVITPILKFGAVSAAGLADSINPCALATIIFFIAYLRVRQIAFNRILLAGTAFCLGVFITYLAVGWGLLNILYRVHLFTVIRVWLNAIIAISCFILGGISIYDAVISKITLNKDTQAKNRMVLKLPEWARRFIHQKIRTGIRLKTGNKTSSVTGILLSGYILGSIISVIEGICTGQVYLPTIIFLVKEKYSVTAFLWLLWYNFLFIIPLIILIAMVFAGTRQITIEKWFRNNIYLSKLILAVIFIFIGTLILILK